jgi:dynein heavy chain
MSRFRITSGQVSKKFWDEIENNTNLKSEKAVELTYPLSNSNLPFSNNLYISKIKQNKISENNKNSVFDFEYFYVDSNNKKLTVIDRFSNLSSSQSKKEKQSEILKNFTDQNINKPIKINFYRFKGTEMSSEQVEHFIELSNSKSEKDKSKLFFNTSDQRINLNQEKRKTVECKKSNSIARPNSTLSKFSRLNSVTIDTKNSNCHISLENKTYLKQANVNFKKISKERPLTSLITKEHQIQKLSQIKKVVSSYERPVSAINNNLSINFLFNDDNSYKRTPQKKEIYGLFDEELLFDFQEQTIFVSKIVQSSIKFSRPSERIALYMQFGQSLKFSHLDEIKDIKKGTVKIFTKDFELPIQNSLLDPCIIKQEMPRRGIMFYMDFYDILDIKSYSIFPEFVDDSVLNIYKLKNLNPLNLTRQAHRHFENRSMLIDFLKEKMNSTYDPSLIIDFYKKKMEKLKNEISHQDKIKAIETYVESLQQFNKYCSDKHIPKLNISKFKKRWVDEIFKLLISWKINLTDKTMKIEFKQVFECYIKSQREWILTYILRSPEERKRLKISHVLKSSMTSSEILFMSGGYHSAIYTSWRKFCQDSKEFLLKKEILFNEKLIAIKNWISHFESLKIFENQFVSELIKNGYSFNVSSFFKLQNFYLLIFEGVLTNILKRGVLCLIDQNFYLKKSDSKKFANFNLFGCDEAIFVKINQNSKDFELFIQKYVQNLNLPLTVCENLVEAYILFFNNLVNKTNKNVRIENNEIKNDLMPIHKNMKSNSLLDMNDRFRIMKITFHMIEEFCYSKIEEFYSDFQNFLRNEIPSKTKDFLLTRPLFSLNLNFSEEDFYFDESIDDIQKQISDYFEKVIGIFECLKALKDEEITLEFEETEDIKKSANRNSCLKKSFKNSEFSLIEKNNFIKQFSSRMSNYIKKVQINTRNDEKDLILKHVRGIEKAKYEEIISGSQLTSRIELISSNIHKSVLEYITEEYHQSLQSTKILSKYKCLLSKNLKEQSLLLLNFKKNQYPVFSMMILSIYNHESVPNPNFFKDKINWDEVVGFKDKLFEISKEIKSIPVHLFFSLFKIRNNFVLQKMIDSIEEIEKLIRLRFLERILFNSGQLLEIYSSLTLKLRTEVNCSADYAKYRKFVFESTQEKSILLYKNKEIFDELNLCLKYRLIEITRDLEPLSQVFHLSKTDKQLGFEIERGSERVSLCRGEFERKLKEDKLIFQSECEELSIKIQVYKNLSDWRNYTSNYEDLSKLKEELRILKSKYEDIDKQELDLYERRYKTNELEGLDDIILPSLEIWKFAYESLTFIKKSLGTPVYELNKEEINQFVKLTLENLNDFKQNQKFNHMENLKLVLQDVEQEINEYFEIKEIVKIICHTKLSQNNWKEFLKEIKVEIEFPLLTLRTFFSLYNNKNAEIFKSFCKKVIYKKNLFEKFEILEEKTNSLKPVIGLDSGFEKVLNWDSLIDEIDDLINSYQNMIFEAEGNEILESFNILGDKLKIYIKLFPLIKHFQFYFEKLDSLFKEIEYSISIEKEYKQFCELTKFYEDLIFNLKENGFPIVSSQPNILCDIKLQIASIEIMLNHKIKKI